MAKLWLEHHGIRYEKKYNGKAAFWVGPDGKQIKGSIARQLDEAQREQVVRAHPDGGRRRVELTESTRRILHEANERSYKARTRKRISADIAEADHMKHRETLLKRLGMNEKEAALAARGRRELY
jgi:hypothetical protein